MDKVDITIIGAGIVGLAIAAELSKKLPNKDIILLEKHDSYGQETSSRNSEVVHAGIYYTNGSLKAKLCIEGRKLVQEICEKNNILLRKMGKIIVAIDNNEVVQLEELFQKGKNNGVDDLEIIDGKKIKELEPNVLAIKALYSPSTAVVDSHNLMKYFFNSAKNSGVIFSFATELTACSKDDSGYVLEANGGEYSFQSEMVINSAGLFSDQVAAMVGIDVLSAGYKINFLKGEYFSYKKAALTRGLVYPVPKPDNKSLGIHTLLDIAGSMKFGPSAFSVDELNYEVDPRNAESFAESIKAYLPQVRRDDLTPDQSGIRPKLGMTSGKEPDFIIKHENAAGFPGFINLIGIESPGLTASPAIARYVANLI